MDAKLRSRIEGLLLAERDRAADALHRAEADEAEQPMPAGALGRTQWTQADAASDVQEEEADAITATRASAHIAEIDDALRLLGNDPDALTQCTRCRWPIERARLELVPWTRVCALCARADGKLLPDFF